MVGPKGFSRGRANSSLRIDHVDRAFLEFHRIAARFDGNVNQLLRKIQVTVMVNADFRNDKAGVTIPHESIANSHLSHASAPGRRTKN